MQASGSWPPEGMKLLTIVGHTGAAASSSKLVDVRAAGVVPSIRPLIPARAESMWEKRTTLILSVHRGHRFVCV